MKKKDKNKNKIKNKNKDIMGKASLYITILIFLVSIGCFALISAIDRLGTNVIYFQ